MSLTPGFILADDMDAVFVTLPEVAAILAEWDAAHMLDREERDQRDEIVIKGKLPTLQIEWAHPKAPTLSVTRNGECVYVEDPADIAEMRQVLAGQVAP